MQIIFLSSVPLHNLGEGQRVPQLLSKLSELDGVKTHFVDAIAYTPQKRIFMEKNVNDVVRFAVSTGEDVYIVVTAPLQAYLSLLESKYSQVRVIYDRFDAWELFPVSQAIGDWYNKDIELEIVRRADGVMSSFDSEINAEATSFLLLPNGASDAPLWPQRRFSNRWANEYVKRAQNVYVGALDSRYINTALLQKCEAPTIVCGCPSGRHIAPNGLSPEQYGKSVTLLGWTGHRHLSFVFSGSSLGLAPFQLIGLSKYVSPIKVYEYLLAGLRPVVMGAELATSLPYVLYANTEEEFLNIANNPNDYALSDEERAHAVDCILTAHTWSVRARELKEWLKTL